jgi:hypothetical protein
MNFAESKTLKIDSRVCWQGKDDDGGKVTDTNWNAVTIAWDNGQVSDVHHGDMREIRRVK